MVKLDLKIISFILFVWAIFSLVASAYILQVSIEVAITGFIRGTILLVLAAYLWATSDDIVIFYRR